MTIIQSGSLSRELLLVNPTQDSVRFAQYPLEVTGAYRLGAVSGNLTGLGAGANVFSFRYTGSGLAIITHLKIEVASGTNFGAAQALEFSAIFARSFTASDSGGTTIAVGGNAFKKRTSHASTGVGDVRISTTAALTAGTRTLDSQPFHVMSCGVNSVAPANTGYNASWHESLANQDYAVTMANNEGFVVQSPIAYGVTGTNVVSVNLDWIETTTSNF